MKKIKINDAVTLELAPLAFQELFVNEFEGGRVSTSAHLSQERTMVYPARNLGTGFGDGLFDNPEGDKYASTRHTLVSVPEGSDEEVIKAKLEGTEDGTIFRILSNNIMDVIGSKNKNALEQGLTDLDVLRARHIVQNGDGDIFANYTKDGNELPEEERVVGKVIKEDGKTVGMEITNENAILEYKTDVFSRTYRADEDKRKFVNVGTQEEVVAEAETPEIQA